MVTSNTNTREHLEDSILLAYLRRQPLEDRLSLRISRHINMERCSRCRLKLDELAQTNATLDVLGQMLSYQHYPEMSVADIYARVQRDASKRTALQAYLHRINNRQRPRMSAVRLVSLPVAFALTILFTIVIVFASWYGRPWISGSSSGGTSTSQNISTSLPRQHSTPTLNLALTATANAGTSISPTVTPVTGPYIEICSTPINIARWRLVICGHNFEAGYKVTLVASGNVPVRLPNLRLDKQGDFKVGWNIMNCGNLPSAIVAHEVVNAKTISARLQNISFGSCLVRTHTSRAN